MTGPFEWTVPRVPSAVSHIRNMIRGECTALAPTVLDAALLVTSELVTNAIRHGDGDILVRCWPRPGGVRLEVHDGSARPPRPRDPGLDAEGGRGLLVVQALATAWGVTPLAPAGKAVWAEIGPTHGK